MLFAQNYKIMTSKKQNWQKDVIDSKNPKEQKLDNDIQLTGFSLKCCKAFLSN